MNSKERVWAVCDEVHRDLKLAGLAIDGSATDGTVYSSIKEMWTAELGLCRLPRVEERPTSCQQAADGKGGDPEKEDDKPAVVPARWYERAYNYWEDTENCAPDDNGVLGGYGHISPADVSGSASFLDRVKSLRPKLGDQKAADCGGGIGRVTKNLLLNYFDEVDIVEQSPRLLRAAPAYVGGEKHRIECICLGLQDFHPLPDTYDLLWIQWVVGHFTDVDFIKFLRRCQAALKEGGLIVIKDNVVPRGEGEGAFKVDREDSSLTRSLGYFRSLFNLAGLTLKHEEQQEGFPGEIFPVYMFALE